MAGDKQGLIAALNECAALMQLAGENPFRCRAYEQGAHALEAIEGSPEQWVAQGTLAGVKGIGKGLSEAIAEYAATGTFVLLEELRRKIPPATLQLMTIPGLGPKKIQILIEKLGIQSIDALESAARTGALNTIAGFGAKTAEKIISGIEQRRSYAARHLIDTADAAAATVIERLRVLPGVLRIAVAGSVRRRRETIKDVDIVATSHDPAALMQAFVTMPQVEKIVAHGETKSSVLLYGGVPVDLRVVAEHQFAAALNYFTGSKEHNTALRGRARRMGLKLNEYGLYRVNGPATVALEETEPGAPMPHDELLPTPDEPAIYAALGLVYVEPEQRENTGEIEAAIRAHETGTHLPRLVQLGDMRGMLHCHTTWSDGLLSVDQLAAATQVLGYRYLCICDHSQTAAYAGGLKPDALQRQWDEIDRHNAQHPEFHIFKGIESDILERGALDYPDALLARLDMVVASIHSRMSMDRASMTDRVCRALEHPATRILGHPTGRLLLRREPFLIDLDRVFETAARHRVVIEINASPHRLDLDWRFISQARTAGCRFAVNPDAHAADELENVIYGIGVARKGGLTAAEVLNTLELEDFKRWLHTREF